jgi:hypothetical protein
VYGTSVFAESCVCARGSSPPEPSHERSGPEAVAPFRQEHSHKSCRDEVYLNLARHLAAEKLGMGDAIKGYIRHRHSPIDVPSAVVMGWRVIKFKARCLNCEGRWHARQRAYAVRDPDISANIELFAE